MTKYAVRATSPNSGIHGYLSFSGELSTLYMGLEKADLFAFESEAQRRADRESRYWTDVYVEPVVFSVK